MNDKRGDVILVPFPFSDLSTSKQRPALVVSSDAFNLSHNDVIVVALTGQVPAISSSDEFIVPPHELGSCGLLKQSLVKLSKIVTLHQQLVIKRIGTLPSASLMSVLAGI